MKKAFLVTIGVCYVWVVFFIITFFPSSNEFHWYIVPYACTIVILSICLISWIRTKWDDGNKWFKR